VSLFDFITDEDFRESLESDFREMVSCIDAEAWKAAHVLAGSIIEAVLIDYIVSVSLSTREQALKMDFGEALTLCRDNKIISSKTADLSSVVKGYRNLIHPGRLIRLNERIDRNSAEVARSLVNIVVGEIEKRKRENYGYTAEQIVAKLMRDSTADVIVSHLLRKTNAIEIERLLLKVLPETYARSLDDETPHYALSAFVICFRTAFEQASDELKSRVVGHFAVIFKEESDEVISSYVIPFLRARDLKHIPQEDADLVKQHLFGRLKRNASKQLMQALEGIGSIATSDDIQNFTDPLVRIITTGQEARLKPDAQNLLVQEWNNMPSSIDLLLLNRLDDWITFYRQNDKESLAERVEAIKASIPSFPF
jgi:hypothetical protein